MVKLPLPTILLSGEGKSVEKTTEKHQLWSLPKIIITTLIKTVNGISDRPVAAYGKKILCINCTNHNYIAKLIHPKKVLRGKKRLCCTTLAVFLFSPAVWNYHQTVNQRHCVFLCWPLNVKGLDCYWVKLPKEARDRPWMKSDYYSDGFSCNVNVKFLSVHCAKAAFTPIQNENIS